MPGDRPQRKDDGEVMMPRVVRGVVSARVDDGLVLRGVRGTVRLSGRHVGQWWDNLRPVLDGSSTVDGLLARVRPEQVASLRRFLTELHSGGVVEDAASGVPAWDELTGQMTSVRAGGSGDVIAEAFEEVVATGRIATRRISPSYSAVPEVASAMPPGGLLVCFGGVEAAPMMRELTLRRREQGRLCLPVLVTGRYVWIGPLTGSAGSGCWECFWLRLRDRYSEECHFDGEVDRCAARLLAAQCFFLGCDILTRWPEPRLAWEVQRVDVASVGARLVAYGRHPRCVTHGQGASLDGAELAKQWEAARGAPVRPDSSWEQALAHLVDVDLGIFHRAGLAGDLRYTAPFNVASVELIDPAGATGTGRPTITVTGFGLRVADAARAAHASACERYAAALADVLDTWPGPESADAPGYWAWSVPDHRPVRLARVPRFADAWRDPGEGANAVTAVRAGGEFEPTLLKLLFDGAGKLVARGDVPACRATLTPAVLAARPVRHLLRIAESLGHQVVLSRLSTPLSAPCVLAGEGDQSHVGVGRSLTAAAADAIQGWLGQRQLGGMHRYESVDDTDDEPDPNASLPRDTTEAIDHMAASLGAAGFLPAVRLLAHDPALAATGPVILALILERTAS
jgi:hypothetical protein